MLSGGEWWTYPCFRPNLCGALAVTCQGYPWLGFETFRPVEAWGGVSTNGRPYWRSPKVQRAHFLAQDCQIVCVDLVKKWTNMVTILLLVYHKLKQIGLTQRTRDKSPTHHCRDKQFQAFSLPASLSIFIKSQLENPQDKMINPYKSIPQLFPIFSNYCHCFVGHYCHCFVGQSPNSAAVQFSAPKNR